MDEKKNSYGLAALFLRMASAPRESLLCSICGTMTLEFKEGNEKHTIYECTSCGMLQSVPVRSS